MEAQGTRALYAADELTAVAHLLGLPAFPGVDGLGDPAAREAGLTSARRSLLARGVLEIDDEGILSIASPHALTFGLSLAAPATVLAQRGGPEAESRAWYVHPTTAVEHTVAIGAVHSLEQIGVAEAMPRLLAFLGLDAARAAASSTFTAGRAALDRVFRALADGDVSASSTELPAEAVEFLEALASYEASAYVRALHQEGPSLAGGELSWVDAGERGLWLIEPATGDPEHVVVQAVGSADVVDELLSYLPGAGPKPTR